MGSGEWGVGNGEWGIGNGHHESLTADYDSLQIRGQRFPLPIPHSPLPSLTIQSPIPHSTPSFSNPKDEHCMSDHTFSLIHHTAPPKSGLNGKPPLLLLLHGYGANEDDLFSLAPYLDERFRVVSARAPV